MLINTSFYVNIVRYMTSYSTSKNCSILTDEYNFVDFGEYSKKQENSYIILIFFFFLNRVFRQLGLLLIGREAEKGPQIQPRKNERLVFNHLLGKGLEFRTFQLRMIQG